MVGMILIRVTDKIGKDVDQWDGRVENDFDQWDGQSGE